MIHIYLGYGTKEHKDAIDMLKRQMKSLQDSADIILQGLDNDDITPVDRIQIQMRLDTYDSALSEVKSRIKEYELLRTQALN